MALNTILKLGDVNLTEAEAGRIQHQLDALERRLVHHPDPTAEAVFKAYPARRQVEVKLRLQLGPLGGHLVSQQSAETPDRAVHLAVTDLERQLERRLANQRGEQSFGVPSRRLPRQLRPSPAPGAESTEPEEPEA